MALYNGIFAVLIICIPNRFDTIPYENHIVWNNAESAGPNLKTNHNMANTIKSNAELSGPIKIINCLIALMLHFLGFFKESISTLSMVMLIDQYHIINFVQVIGLVLLGKMVTIYLQLKQR